MEWVIITVIIFICVFLFVGRVYSKPKVTPKKDQTQGVADNANGNSSNSNSDE